jgi:hypothetical protein
MAKIKKRFTIKETNLAADWGQAEPLGGNRFIIRIDRKHRGERSRMNTLIHEAVHIADMDGLSEARVRHITAVVVEALWRQNYRRVRE